MAKMDLEALTSPLSEADPCGPDLELEGDADYMNFMASAEGLIPETFFEEDEDSTGKRIQRPFDRAKATPYIEAAEPLAGKTRDLRLLVLLTKLYALERNLGGFGTCVEAIARLLDERWDEVHPRGEDGDFSMRVVVLETLNDRVPVLLPLQFMPIAEHKRLGTITYRTHVIAKGEGGKAEEKVEAPVLEKILAEEVPLAALVAPRDACDNIIEALARIRKVCAERLGVGAVRIEALPELVTQMRAFLEGVIVQRDPSAAKGAADQPASASAQDEPATDDASPDASAPALAAIKLGSIEEVADALAAATEYFNRTEPSNPALLLLNQAKALIGRSFLDAMRLLIPAQVEKASLRIGSELAFELPLQRLEAAVQPAADGAAAGEVKPNGHDAAAGDRKAASSRREAIALLEQVSKYYRVVEPSSPIPLLTDRACALAGKDFMALLGDVTPKKA